MSRTITKRRESERGYALLMIFLMAAIIAIFLYQQLPRVAFETEREKEQLLIDRGEQYVRAIQLYYIHNNRQYPTSIEDLEKQEHRYLRRRYVDPYTGKDEWRIIHTNGGFLTDSLVQKPPTGDDKQNPSSPLNAGATPANPQQPQVNAAVLQRPSDRPVTPQGAFSQAFPPQDLSPQLGNNGPLPPITLQPQQQPGQGALPPITLATPQQQGQPQGQNGLPPITVQPPQGGLPPITLQPGAGQSGGLPPITLANPTGAPITPQGGPQIPGQLPGQAGVRPGQFPGQLTPGGLPGGVQTGIPPGFQLDPSGRLVPVAPQQGQPGQPPQGIPGLPIPPQPGDAQNPPFGQPGINPPVANQPGGAQQGSPNAALGLINQLLTNPRQTSTTPTVSTNNQIGAIAGVASTHKGPSIKIYKDQTQYEMWEFVFSPTASTVPGAGGGLPGVPQNTPGSNQPQQPSGNQPLFGAPNQIGTPNQGGSLFPTSPTRR